LAQNEYPKSGYQFQPTKDFQFRVTDPNVVLKPRQVDFNLKEHKDPIRIADNVVELDSLPKFWSEKHQRAEERIKIAEGLKDKVTWNLYHKKLPLGHISLAQNLDDKLVKKEKTPFLNRDKWESAYV
jgi:hypothetical protein